MPESSSDFEGANYQDVMTKLQVVGFTSIETTAVPDLVVGWLHKDGDVKEVSVNGATDFGADDEFPTGARIVIRFHTFPKTESGTVAESQPPEAGSDKAAEGSPVPDEQTPQTAPTSDLAKRTKKATLEAFGVSSFTKLIFAKGMEGSLIPFISRLEVVGAGDTVKVTVQVPKGEVTQKELDQTAFAILSLTGEKVKDLNRVEVWTADNEMYGVSNRAEVPMLNR
jgi:hypothetical protein